MQLNYKDAREDNGDVEPGIHEATFVSAEMQDKTNRKDEAYKRVSLKFELDAGKKWVWDDAIVDHESSPAAVKLGVKHLVSLMDAVGAVPKDEGDIMRDLDALTGRKVKMHIFLEEGSDGVKRPAVKRCSFISVDGAKTERPLTPAEMGAQAPQPPKSTAELIDDDLPDYMQ